jgi:hypothetical protein
MDTETEIYIRYEAELTEIALLDRLYYQKAAPSSADRADYYRRQDHLERVRARLCAELRAKKNKTKTTKVAQTYARRAFISAGD